MIRNPLKFTGSWGCGYGAGHGSILLQADNGDDSARIRLSPEEAEQIAETLWFMAAKARKSPKAEEEYQLQLFQRSYGAKAGRQLHKILMLPAATRRQAITRLEQLSGSKRLKFKPQHIEKAFAELVDGGLLKPIAKSTKRSKIK